MEDEKTVFMVEIESVSQLVRIESRLIAIEKFLLRLLRALRAPVFGKLVLVQTLDGKEVIGMVSMLVGEYYRIAVVGEVDAQGNPIPGAEPQGPCTFTPADPTLATINLNAAVDANGNLTGQNDGLSALVLSTGKLGSSSVAIEDATGTLGAVSNFTVSDVPAGLEIQEGAPAEISSLPASVTGSAAAPAASAPAPAAAAAKASPAARIVPRGAPVPTGLK